MQLTDDDRARDLVADLALCEKATGGAWEASLYSAGEWGVWHIELDVCIASRRHVGASPHAELVGLTDRDAAMIAASRDGWPAAIRRALAAETECERLRKELSWAVEERDRLRELYVPREG